MPAATISLGRRLLDASSSLPGSYAGPDQSAATVARVRCFLFGLAPGGVCLASRSPGLLVSSYLTVSPLPAEAVGSRRYAYRNRFNRLLPTAYRLPSASAVYFLLHFPEPCGRWALPTTVSCGARTFLPRKICVA